MPGAKRNEVRQAGVREPVIGREDHGPFGK
jgi:hypothetical protein